MPPLERFYDAIHRLWHAQAAVGRASKATLAVRVALDRQLRQAMIEVELADEAVRVIRRERETRDAT